MMVLFNNVVVEMENEQIMLMNLRSFRREVITKDEFFKLKKYQEKIEKGLGVIDIEEQQIFDKLLDKKQFFSNEMNKEIDKQYLQYFMSQSNNKNIADSIQINVTYKCNFNCSYCYQKKSNLNPSSEMSCDDILKIRQFCENYCSENNEVYNIKHVAISGGEVLQESYIQRIMDIANVFYDAKLTIISNGLNLAKYWQILPISKIEQFIISLDGCNEVISKLSLEGKDSLVFEKIIEGLKLVVQAGIDLRLQTIITNESVEYLNKLILTLLSENILPSAELCLFSVFDYSSKYDIDLDFYTPEKYIDLHLEAKKILSKHPIKYSISSFGSLSVLLNRLSRPLNARSNVIFSRCRLNDGMKFVFLPDGKVYWCNCVESMKGQIGDFRNFEIYEDIINEYISYNYAMNNECESCDYKYVCAMGCPLYYIGRNLSKNELHCGCFKNEYVMNNLYKLML